MSAGLSDAQTACRRLNRAHSVDEGGDSWSLLVNLPVTDTLMQWPKPDKSGTRAHVATPAACGELGITPKPRRYQSVNDLVNAMHAIEAGGRQAWSTDLDPQTNSCS